MAAEAIRPKAILEVAKIYMHGGCGSRAITNKVVRHVATPHAVRRARLAYLSVRKDDEPWQMTRIE